jgi:hypothetical protein
MNIPNILLVIAVILAIIGLIKPNMILFGVALLLVIVALLAGPGGFNVRL